jgi:Holliday junction resolvasome RuvABC endonuclease subunit
VTYIKVIGIDQSSKISGYSIFVNGKLKRFGTIDVSNNSAGKKETDHYVRMCNLHSQFSALFKKEKPDYVALEAVQMQGGNKHAFMLLSNVQGLLFAVLYSLEIPFVVVEASKWRAHAGISTGKGVKRQQLKEQAMKLATDKYHVEASEDESESIHIAQWLSDVVAANDNRTKGI